MMTRLRARSRRPVIGVTCSLGRGRISWFFIRLAIWRAGGRAVRITTGTPVDFDRLDALLIGGGADIGLRLDGNKPVPVEPTVKLDPGRDTLELSLLTRAERRGLPVLGICRGSQMINIARGGSLFDEIRDHFPINGRYRTVLARKRVTLSPATRLADIVGPTWTRVNALHHQAVDRVGRGLTVGARDQHGMIQAVEGTDERFVVGVQWHPEFLIFSRRQFGLFRALVAAARGPQNARAWQPLNGEKRRDSAKYFDLERPVFRG